MRIMFLNTWAGVLPDIVPYLKKKSESIDIFCLQEVHRMLRVDRKHSRQVYPTKGKTGRVHNVALYNEIEAELRKTHVGDFAPNLRGLHDLESDIGSYIDYGNATFCRYAFRPETTRVGTLHRLFGQANDGVIPASRSMVSMTIRQNGRRFLLAHAHFLWDARGKVDTEDRMRQSRRASAHIAQHRRDESWGEDLPVVFGGDFNLTSSCKTLKRLVSGRFYGEIGGENLNEKYEITDTRTSHYPKLVREADFVLASRSLQARLRVDYEAPSDHAALIVEF